MPSLAPGRPAHGRRRAPFAPILLLVLIVVAVFVAGPLGCADGDNAAKDKATSVVFGPSTSGGLTVTLRVSPYPPKPRDQSQFLVSLVDERGDQVTGAQVGIDITMPAMPMPRTNRRP